LQNLIFGTHKHQRRLLPPWQCHFSDFPEDDTRRADKRSARTCSHQRLGPDGRHRLHDRWKPPIQSEEEQAIAVRELDPTAHLTLKYDQLTSERSVLSLKPADRPERRNQQPQKEEEQRDHRDRRYVIPSPDQTDEVFGTHKS
jgi:hypothetical protein